jgi:hypothetical protein
VGASAGMDGDFSISLNPGTYKFKVTFVSYRDTIVTYKVESGKWTEVTIPLNSASSVTTEFELVETKITNSENAVLNELKEDNTTGNGVSGMEIQKTAATNGAEVARRIPGVTVIDNRFVLVRGLTERYNAVMINNALAPSLESDVKSFSFDIIPSGAIDRFMVYKSASPDLPGEFAGGAIRIHTSNFPDSSGIRFSYSTSYRSGTTFDDFAINPGSKTDWLGFDNGARALPSGYPSNIRNITDPNQLQQYGQALPNTWTYNTISANPDQRFSFGINQRWKLKNEMELGSITSISYSNTKLNFLSNRLDYNTYNPTSGHSDTIFSYADNISQSQARVGLMSNWGLRFKNNTFTFNNFLNQTGTNETTLRTGPNYEEGSDRKEYAFRYNQRTIFTSQLNGEHRWEKHEQTVNKFDWTIGYSLAKRNDPDWRRIRYTKAQGSEDPYAAYIPFSAQPFYMGRLFIDMNENLKMAAANFEHTFITKDSSGIIRDFKPKVKGGFYVENKYREFNVRNLGYRPASIFTFDWNLPYLPVDSLFLPENINSTTGLAIDEDTRKSDSYIAKNNLRAFYLMGEIPLGKLEVSGGVRLEDNFQAIYSGTVGGDTMFLENHLLHILPSVNMVYKFKDSLQKTTQIRFAYGKTINRPEFRELAPLAFYDFVFNSIYQGNSELKTPSIKNFDLRFEHYPNAGEILSFGLFYKDFTNPIEMYFVPGVGSGGTRAFTFDNAPRAISYGFEIDVRKSLKNSKMRFIENLTLVANYSYIKSEIKLKQIDGDVSQTNTTRPMMGQSPYIINAGLFYEDSAGWSFSINYNRIGERVVIVGIPNIPEVYEMPRNLLDLTVSKSFGKYFTIRFSIQDILNQNFILLQDANEDGKLNLETDQRIQYYQRGSYYTMGFQFKLNHAKKEPVKTIE